MSFCKQKKELTKLEINNGISGYEFCSAQEEKEFNDKKKYGGILPDGVFYGDVTDPSTGARVERFYRISENDLSQEEKAKLILLKQLEIQKNILSWVKFFGILTIIGMICAVIAAIVMYSRCV